MKMFENDFKNELEMLDADFDSIKLDETKNEDVPDGVYDCVIKRFELKKDKNGKSYFNWGLQIFSDEHKGRMIWKMQYYDTRGKLFFTKLDLSALGYTTNFSALNDPMTRAEFIGRAVNVTQETKPGLSPGRTFVNIKFNKEIDPPAIDDENGVVDSAPYDPFADFNSPSNESQDNKPQNDFGAPLSGATLEEQIP